MAETKSEKFEFQSEVKQLLNILVYSLYQNKEVFVRELISNAVDALNKIRFESVTGEEVEDRDAELRIDISFQKSKNMLVIEDSGIGMTREELVENIGTIAHSGTMDFLQKLQEKKDKDQVDLIGKFGVGFYSCFMAAKEVHILTKSARKGSPALLWKSSGDSSYTIEAAVKKKRGTRIEILLKKEESEYLDSYVIKNIISKYSKFVPFPIYIENEKLEVVDAIWTQPKSSLKDKDYIEFYKFQENTQEEPETWLHLSSDAPVQFHAILFVPKSSMESMGLFKSELGVDLYSRKVLIQKGSKEIMPEYLRFIKGVIDSEDVPLNISRETIQRNLHIDKIRKHVIKKLLSHIQKIKQKDLEKYQRIWTPFHRHFKEGIATDFDHREALASLLLFHSSKGTRDDLLDLKEYTSRMKPEQKEIIYVTGLDLDSIDNNPALEAFRKKDWEVLYLDDPLDEFVVEHLREFDGKPFQLAESAEITVDREQPEDDAFSKKIEAFLAYLKKLYGGKVADVRISSRLVDSPCILVHPSDGPSIHVEKILKMTNKDYQFSKKVLEINRDSALIREMVRVHASRSDSKELETLAQQLLDNMLLREGIVQNIDEIVPRMQDIMLKAAKSMKPARAKKAKPA